MKLLESEERSRKGHQAAGPRQMIKSWEWDGAELEGDTKEDRIWEGKKGKGPR